MTADERISLTSIYEKVEAFNFQASQILDSSVNSMDLETREDSRWRVISVALSAFMEAKTIIEIVELQILYKERLNIMSHADTLKASEKMQQEIMDAWTKRIQERAATEPS